VNSVTRSMTPRGGCEPMPPAHVQSSRFGLRITFERCGEERDSAVADTPDRALKAAILLLVSLDDLIDGDRLSVMEVTR
jgi:hypothetical protein